MQGINRNIEDFNAASHTLISDSFISGATGKVPVFEGLWVRIHRKNTRIFSEQRRLIWADALELIATQDSDGSHWIRVSGTISVEGRNDSEGIYGTLRKPHFKWDFVLSCTKLEILTPADLKRIYRFPDER